MSALGDCKSLGEYDAILMELLTRNKTSLIVRPWTEVVRLSRKHATLITPCWIDSYKSTTIYIETIVRTIQCTRNIIFNSFSYHVAISRLTSLCNISFCLFKSLCSSYIIINITCDFNIITTIKITALNSYTS